MFDVDGKHYELKMNMNRLELVEGVTGKSMMAELKQTEGMFPLYVMKACFQLCCREVGSTDFLNQDRGQQVFERYIGEAGYSACVAAVVEAMMKDLPFLFQVS